MLGRDRITPVAKLLEPKPRYYGERGAALKMDTLRRLYMIVVQNIRKAREKVPTKEEELHKFKVNDMVLVKDPDAAVFEPRYQPNFRVTAIFGNNRIEVQDERGHKSVRRSTHVKYKEPSEKVEKQLPSKEVIKNYGRSAKLLLAPRDIPDLQFAVAEREDKGDSPKKTDVIELMNVNIEDCVTLPRNSDFQEHSRNSLQGVAGEAQVLLQDQRSLETALDSKLQSSISEYREHSQKSQDNEKTTDKDSAATKVKRKFSRDMHLQHSGCREHSRNLRIQESVGVAVTVSAEDTKCSAPSSDFPEHSQNSLSRRERETDNEDENMSFGDRDGLCAVVISKFRELSPNSRVLKETTEGRPQHTSTVCVSEPSEYSRDSLGVGNNVSVPSFSWLKSMSQIVGLTATLQDKVEGNPVGANTAGNAYGHNRLDLKSSKFNGDYIFLVPKIKLQNFKNR